MSNFEEDFNFFANILNDLVATEKALNSLYSEIQRGLTKCWLPVLQEEVSPIEPEDPVSSSLLEEVEEALSKARLIYQNASSASELRPKKIEPLHNLLTSKTDQNHRGGSVARKPKSLVPTVAEKGQNLCCTRSKSPIRPTSAQFLPAHLKAPFQTYDQRVKTPRNANGGALLRRNARSLIQHSGVPEDFPNQQADNNATKPTGHILPPIVSNSCVSSQSSSLQNFKNNALTKSKPNFILHPDVEKRVEELVEFDFSLSKCSAAFRTESQCSDRKIFSEYLLHLAEKKIDDKFLSQYVSNNLSEVVSLFKEFLKLNSSIDWSLATEGQKSWKHQLLRCFGVLFESIDIFLPTLPDDQTVKEDLVTAESAEFSADMDTLWKAYICSGEAVDPNSPEFLSRSQLLSVGPAVFSSATVSDLQKLLGLWQDICHFQRKLNVLSYAERRLPDWLSAIGQLKSGKASAYRLLYGLVLGCPPVALAKETCE